VVSAGTVVNVARMVELLLPEVLLSDGAKNKKESGNRHSSFTN